MIPILKSRAALCAFALLLSACPARPFTLSETPLVIVSLDQPKCGLTSTAEALPLHFSTDTAVRLVIELTLPNGRVRVLDRPTVEGQGDYLIPPESLAAGRNRIAVWIDQGGRSARQVFTIDAQDPIPGASSVDTDGDCYSAALGDCNDADPAIHPGAADPCNGVDDDCSGLIDEAFDIDGDSYVACPDATAVTWRTAPGTGCPPDFTTCADCDDHEARTFPGAFTSCTDTADRSCGGVVILPQGDDDNDGVLNCADADADNDGLCDPGAAATLTVVACADPNAPDGACCSDPGTGDNCPRVRNAAQADFDSDGIGDACDTCSDFDLDGYGRAGTYVVNQPAFAPIGAAVDNWLPTSSAERAVLGTLQLTACTSGLSDPDCNDNQGASYPGNTEVCDGNDNNCNGQFDEGFDVDGDGYVDCGVTFIISQKTDGSPCPTGYTTCRDCDDGGGGAAVHPGVAETCDGIDQDCFGGADQRLAADGAPTGIDPDGDNYNACGSWNGSGPVALSAALVDCAECTAADCMKPGLTGAQVHPGASDSCDGVDNDCNGTADDPYDQDGDTYTTCGAAKIADNKYDRNPPGNTIADGFDCNDDPDAGGATMNPGVVDEICDGLDNNCNCPYGTPGNPSSWAALGPSGFTVNCIDDTPDFDLDNDGFAGHSSCPAFLARDMRGRACGISVANRAANCRDCNECTAASCAAPGIKGDAIHPNLASTAPGSRTENDAVGASCSDAIDNDCDGYVDSTDSECVPCVNQTELYRESFDNGDPAAMIAATTHWQRRTATVGPRVDDLSEGRTNNFFGTDGNQGTREGPLGPRGPTDYEAAESTESYWIAGHERSGDLGTGTLSPFDWSATVGRRVYMGFRSYTFNTGYPRWDANGPVALDGGNCSDTRGQSFNLADYPRMSFDFNSLTAYPVLLPLQTDVERVRVSTQADPTACISNSAASFTTVASCDLTPELALSYDGTVRVVKTDITAALGGARTQVFLCGRFNTREENADAAVCWGGTGTTLTAYDPVRATPYFSTADPVATDWPTCNVSTNRDDGWYLDDLVVYACDSGACNTTPNPTTGIPPQFWCKTNAPVCCTSGTERCEPASGCTACDTANGAVGCNQTCCPKGQYCADFQNSVCAVANVDAACGPNRAQCTNGTTCAYVDPSAGEAAYPPEVYNPYSTPSPTFDGAPRDCTADNADEVHCRCVAPIYDDLCGTGFMGSPPRENCLQRGTSAGRCMRCPTSLAQSCICIEDYVPCGRGAGASATGENCFCRSVVNKPPNGLQPSEQCTDWVAPLYCGVVCNAIDPWSPASGDWNISRAP